MASSNSPLAAFTRWPAQALPRTFWRGRPWLQALLGLGLALFAAWIRLRHLGYTEIFHDQARTLNLALQWLHGGPFPLTADFSSLGVYNPPLVEYLYALALFVKEDILSAAWLVALVNLIGVLAAGWATARVFGARAAWWATLLFVVNPWAVHYGRLIWMQSFVPGFAALLFACVLLYFAADARPIWLILGALCLSATIQVHLTAVALLPSLLMLGLCFPRRLRLWPLVVAGAAFVLSFAPFAIYQVRTGFADWQALREGLSQTSRSSLASVLVILDLLQSKGIYATLGSAGDRWRALDPLGRASDAVVSVLFGAAMLYALTRVLRDGLVWLHRRRSAAANPIPEGAPSSESASPGGPRDEEAGRITMVADRSVRGGMAPRRAWLILALWMLVPAAAFLRHTHYLQNYYFLYLFPVPFILLASFADVVYTRLRWQAEGVPAPWARSALRWGALAAFLPLAFVAFQQARLDVIGQNLRAAGASGRQRVVDVQRAIESARWLLRARNGCSLVVISDGAEYESSRFALMREFVGADRVRFLQAGGGFLLPVPCAVYFSADRHATTDERLKAWTRPLPDWTIQTPEERWTFRDLSRADREVALADVGLAAKAAEWEYGVRLSGIDVEGEWKAGGMLTLRGVWEVTRAVLPRPMHFGNYVLSEGVVVVQVDGPGVDSTQWRKGDVFETRFSLSLPLDLRAGDYALAVALYSWPDGARLPLVSGGDLLVLEERRVAAPAAEGDP